MSFRLAYCGLGVSDVDAWMHFGVEALGMVAQNQGEVGCLRIDEKAWRFALYENPADDILFAGFECDDETILANKLQALTNIGIQCTSLNAQELSERDVEAGFYLLDPDGLRIEFIIGHKDAAITFQSNLVSGFVTGPQGLGHIVLAITDLDASIAFYEKIGFSLSDFITQKMGPAELRIAFMHCNLRHHSLAIAALPGGKRLNHIMIECKHVDDVLVGYRRCTEQGHKVGEIGRHTNDEMLSFYVPTPAGFDIELGWGGKEIHGQWSVKEFNQISLWGHERAV